MPKDQQSWAEIILLKYAEIISISPQIQQNSSQSSGKFYFNNET